MSEKKVRPPALAAFLVIGIGFITIGIGGNSSFIPIGCAFIVIGIAAIARARKIANDGSASNEDRDS